MPLGSPPISPQNGANKIFATVAAVTKARAVSLELLLLLSFTLFLESIIFSFAHLSESFVTVPPDVQLSTKALFVHKYNRDAGALLSSGNTIDCKPAGILDKSSPQFLAASKNSASELIFCSTRTLHRSIHFDLTSSIAILPAYSGFPQLCLVAFALAKYVSIRAIISLPVGESGVFSLFFSSLLLT